MAALSITGGRPLTGTVRTPGSKNAVLPLMAASLLFEAPIRLLNVPTIRDVDVMVELLKRAGKKVERPSREELAIRPDRELETTVAHDLAKRLRASVLLLGPLLARTGKVSLPHPGGDLIGPRPINLHLDGVRAMGATVTEQQGRYLIKARLHGADLDLELPTVTGTENLLMAASLADGMTTINNPAQEAHVACLVRFLKAGGVRIDEPVANQLRVYGRGGQPLGKHLTFSVPPDELDAGTFAVAALVTGGTITIDPFPAGPLQPLTEKLVEIGAQVEPAGRDKVTIRPTGRLSAFDLTVGYAPGFATDLQPPMTVLATQAHGRSTIHDSIYENRFGYIGDLARFGAQIRQPDQQRIIVDGPAKLDGQIISSPDIRAGIAFVLAALVAKGQSKIENVEIIERGYADLVPRLAKLGAHISRSD